MNTVRSLITQFKLTIAYKIMTTSTLKKTTNIGIAENNLSQIIQLLNKLLADEYILNTKTHNYHWNVQGPSFYEYHKLLEIQYQQLDLLIDELAERIRSVGGNAIGTLTEFLKLSRLKEQEATYPKAETMISNLLADHEQIIRTIGDDSKKCQELEDDGSADFLLGLKEQHEKMAWMLRSTIA
jgi:starvation-inducible DNA-binding protein